jgi:hypothetical protein
MAEQSSSMLTKQSPGCVPPFLPPVAELALQGAWALLRSLRDSHRRGCRGRDVRSWRGVGCRGSARLAIATLRRAMPSAFGERAGTAFETSQLAGLPASRCSHRAVHPVQGHRVMAGRGRAARESQVATRHRMQREPGGSTGSALQGRADQEGSSLLSHTRGNGSPSRSLRRGIRATPPQPTDELARTAAAITHGVSASAMPRARRAGP